MRISKDLLRRALFVAIATAIYMALVSALAQAAITAPKCIDAGQLAVAHSDTEATWTVYPVQYQTAIYVADGGMTCVFASPVKGEVTIIAATIEEGKVVLSQHVLYNGLPMPTPDPVDPTPTPTPTPDPPKPTPPPEPDKTPLELALEKATVYPAKNVQALAATFASVKSGIDRGTVTTVVAARETFRSIWIANAAEVDPQAIKTMGGWIEELSACIDNTSLETIKRDYAVIAEALKANAVARVGADEETRESLINNLTDCIDGETLNTFAGCFDDVVAGIDGGTISSPESAGETLRVLWAGKTKDIEEKTKNECKGIVDKIVATVDAKNLDTVKDAYKDISKIIKECAANEARADEPTDQEEPAKEKPAETPKPTSNCPNGQCPNQQGQVIQRGGFFWR